jgi:hypothetical protein
MPLGKKRATVKYSTDPGGNIYVQGFAGGFNSLVSPQHIADNECSILQNAQLIEDGVVTRRDGNTYFDSAADGGSVVGLYPFTTYDTSGNRTTTLMKMDDSGNLKKWTGSAWATITGFTYTAGARAQFAQGKLSDGKDYAYVGNGIDPLSRTDGGTITTFNTVTDPNISTLTVAQQGTTGASSYAYTYSLVTKYGETLPADTGGSLPNYKAITNGNATLSATNYVKLTITRSSDPYVTGYNVYGRTIDSLLYLGFVPQTASGDVIFSDDGTAVPNNFFGIPLQNSTEGIKGSFLLTYHDTLIIAGIPTEPSRMYYSAGLDKFDDFQIVNGGGSILVNREDGDVITALVVYKDKVVIFKNRSSYLFEFNTPPALPSWSVINPEIGCVSPQSAKVVLNDVYFLGVGGTGVFTLGYQSGYFGVGQADMLRTNEVSVKIHPTLAATNTQYLNNVIAIHSPSHYKYILAVPNGGSTTNDTCYVYDTRYGSWVVWDNIHPNCFTSYLDINNQEQILYGDALEGRVNKMFTGTSDNGAAFAFKLRTKDFNAKAFHLLKTFIWPTFHFRNIIGGVTVTTVTDGANTQDIVQISSTTSFTGWSFDRWANFLWGTTAGTSASASSADAPRQKNIRIDARSIMFLFENTSASDSISILGVECNYILRRSRRLPSQYIIS